MRSKQYALELAKHDYKVFPLVPNTKRPLKDHSYLTASKDLQEISNWFDHEPNINLGLSLSDSNLIVVDIDNHNNNDIRSVFQALSDQDYSLPADTYIEQTPSGGLHLFYRGQVSKKRVTNYIPSVDLLADFTVIAPSVVNGDTYRSINTNYTYNTILDAPKWLLDALNDRPVQQYPNSFKRTGNVKKWTTGKRLDEIVAGVDSGGRNMWLTRQIGWLIGTGAELATAYTIAQQINRDYIRPPLKDSEVNTIFKSIKRKEAAKWN